MLLIKTSNYKNHYYYFLLSSCLLCISFPFTSIALLSYPRDFHTYSHTRTPVLTKYSFSTSLKSTTSSTSSFEAKREDILNRGESFFELNPKDGSIEFGSTARLVTTLEKNPLAKPVINQWLAKEHRVAASIWDPTLMQPHGNNLYTLELMTVQFITITLAPRVVVSMWTEKKNKKKNTASSKSSSLYVNMTHVADDKEEEVDYIFKIESISFDPNIKLLSLPGMPAEVTAQDLGIHIGVVGELGISKEGTGLFGAIGFKTRGTLPTFIRLLPKSVLQGAVEAINQQIVTFAISNFQRGAAIEYGKYRREILAEYESRKQKQQQLKQLQEEQN